MSTSKRARILVAKQDGLPAEDLLRFVQPRAYLPALRMAPQAYSAKAANDGLEFVNILSGKSGAPRPLARRGNAVQLAGMVEGRIPDACNRLRVARSPGSGV